MRNRRREIFIILAIMLVCIAGDQALKLWAGASVPKLMPQSYLGDTVRLHYKENSGAFMSLGAGLPRTARFWIFTVGVGLVLVLMLAATLRAAHLRFDASLAMAFLLGGGFGNFIDRAINEGAVVDYINLGLFGLRTATFNLADMCINTGFVLLLIITIRHKSITRPPAGTERGPAPGERAME